MSAPVIERETLYRHPNVVWDDDDHYLTAVIDNVLTDDGTTVEVRAGRDGRALVLRHPMLVGEIALDAAAAAAFLESAIRCLDVALHTPRLDETDTSPRLRPQAAG